MSSSFTSALRAAHDAAAAQSYPHGALYVVATPIGNLADIGLRALHVLSICDALACEDTRHSQALLRAWGIEPARQDGGGARWIALHRHNEAQAAETVLERLRLGHRIAYLSDAGTPAVSDPGARLVAAVRAAGHRVVPLPGASSVTAALSVAGIVDGDDGFVFHGFLPARAGERVTALQRLAAEPRAVVLLEAPHRIELLAQSLAVLGERRLTVARELTKQFEQVETLAASALSGWLAADAQRLRGEFVLVLHPSEVMAGTGAVADEAVRALGLLLDELPVKSAVRLAAEITGAPRNALYECALRLRAGRTTEQRPPARGAAALAPAGAQTDNRKA